jgi:hypothetical protein
VIFAFEIVGFLAYFENRKRLKTRYVAGINPDMAGEDQKKCKSTLNIYQAPDACASFVNPLTLRLVKKAAGSSLKYAVKNFIVNDNSITDPALGPPCTALIHLRDRFYHSNEDSPDKVSESTLIKVGAVIAAFLYLCATPDEKIARDIAELCLAYARERFTAEPLSPEKRAYILECESRRLRDLAKAARSDLRAFEDRLAALAGRTPVNDALSPAEPSSALVKKASSLVPVRRVMGPLTFERIPPEKRLKMKFQPHWSRKWNLPLFWADGKRDL